MIERGAIPRTPLTLAATALITAMLATSASAEIYKWVDENGVVHYTNQRPSSEPDEVQVIEEEYASDSEPASDDDPAAAEAVTADPSRPQAATAGTVSGAGTPAQPAAGAPATAASPGKKVRSKAPPPVDAEGNPFQAESFDRRR